MGRPVDVSAYVPRHADQALTALGSRFGRCRFISTGSVYGRLRTRDHLNEDTPRASLPSETRAGTFTA